MTDMFINPGFSFINHICYCYISFFQTVVVVKERQHKTIEPRNVSYQSLLRDEK
jgi:hypothetical protein